MKPEELRIGNIVEYREEYVSIATVSNIQNHFTALRNSEGLTKWPVDIEDCEPIPITDKILEMLGFEKKKIVKTGVYLKYVFGEWTIEDVNEFGFFLYSETIEHLPNFQYVHQLQNLIYTVGGIELGTSKLRK